MDLFSFDAAPLRFWMWDVTKSQKTSSEDRQSERDQSRKTNRNRGQKWKCWVMKSSLPEMIKVAKMLAKHLEGLLNFTLFPITNAVAEGFNSKIQSLKADARGFRNALNYRTRILLYCGRLDLFPSTHEIP
jgi:transposase